MNICFFLSKEMNSIDSLQNVSVQQKLELASETARIKQLLEDQEREIKIWKDNYNQLLYDIKNKQNIMLKETLDDILSNNLKQFLITEIMEKNKYIETRIGFNEFKTKKTFSHIKNEYVKIVVVYFYFFLYFIFIKYYQRIFDILFILFLFFILNQNKINIVCLLM
jgi:hypothetical protein